MYTLGLIFFQVPPICSSSAIALNEYDVNTSNPRKKTLNVMSNRQSSPTVFFDSELISHINIPYYITYSHDEKKSLVAGNRY
jgi:hypothetical protein